MKPRRGHHQFIYVNSDSSLSDLLLKREPGNGSRNGTPIFSTNPPRARTIAGDDRCHGQGNGTRHGLPSDAPQTSSDVTAKARTAGAFPGSGRQAMHGLGSRKAAPVTVDLIYSELPDTRPTSPCVPPFLQPRLDPTSRRGFSLHTIALGGSAELLSTLARYLLMP